MKTCSNCKTEKPKSNFYKHKTSNDGLRSQCKLCINKKNKQYRDDHHEKIKIINHNYRDKHKDELREKSKNNYHHFLENHPERIREIRNKAAIKYRETHPEKVKAATRRWKENNPDKASLCAKTTREKYKEKTRQYNVNYRIEHRDELLEKEQLKRLADPEKYREKARKWAEANKEKVIEIKKKTRKKNHLKLMAWHSKYCKTRRDVDPLFKLLTNIRTNINRAIKSNFKSGRAVELIGCSIQDLKIKLENQFTPGMSWVNYGKWHIDHIIPCAAFDLTDPGQQRLCFNYRNLQPLWAIDNLRKHAKVDNLVKEQMIARMTGK